MEIVLFDVTEIKIIDMFCTVWYCTTETENWHKPTKPAMKSNYLLSYPNATINDLQAAIIIIVLLFCFRWNVNYISITWVEKNYQFLFDFHVQFEIPRNRKLTVNRTKHAIIKRCESIISDSHLALRGIQTNSN